VLVNIQRVTEFDCQKLNRDTWSDSKVQLVVQSSFILWQVSEDSWDGKLFQHFYPVKSYPHLAIIDPRTRRCLYSWDSFVLPHTLHYQLSQFLQVVPWDGPLPDQEKLSKDLCCDGIEKEPPEQSKEKHISDDDEEDFRNEVESPYEDEYDEQAEELLTDSENRNDSDPDPDFEDQQEHDEIEQNQEKRDQQDEQDQKEQEQEQEKRENQKQQEQKEEQEKRENQEQQSQLENQEQKEEQEKRENQKQKEGTESQEQKEEHVRRENQEGQKEENDNQEQKNNQEHSVP